MTPALFGNIFLSLLKTERSENHENVNLEKEQTPKKHTH